MKVSMARARAYFKQYINLANIKRKIAQQFGFRVKSKDKVSSKIPKTARPEDSQSASRPIKSRKTEKADTSDLLANKKQARKAFSTMLKSWMSGKPDKAVQSLVELYDQIDKVLILEHHGAIAADDYADEAERVMLELSESLSPRKKLKIQKSLESGGKIYRGLSALTFLQNGTDQNGNLMRHSLSDKANTCLTHICPLYGNLFKEFHPHKADELERQIMEKTDPEKADLSKQEAADIRDAFYAMKRIK